MGFTFDVVTGSINGESMIAQTMAEIEEALKDVTDPAVRNEDDDLASPRLGGRWR